MKKGFTLIELLVTLAIMAIMAVIAIPAFSTFGAKTDFIQQMDQVSALISQAIASQKSPAQGVLYSYVIVLPFNDIDQIIFYQGSSATIDPVNNKSITLNTFNGDETVNKLAYKNSGTPYENASYLVFSQSDLSITLCDSTSNPLPDPTSCFSPTEWSARADKSWFNVVNNKTKQTATFYKYDNPTRVTYQITEN
jgi:type IV pilus assembly protein PilE